MSIGTIEFLYHFVVSPETAPDAHDREVTVKVRLDAATLDEIRDQSRPVPDWAHLATHRCPICPLDAATYNYCPAALSLIELVDLFGQFLSFTRVRVTVTTRERTIHTETTVQRALSSLTGLRMATSGCPILAPFKPMARFHLPFATREETVFRSVGAYLLAQYYRHRRGRPVDLDLEGLRAIYDDIHAVNVGLTTRLRDAVTGDANLNALVILDLFAHELPFSIEDNLAEIEPIFAPFLD